MPCHFCHGCLLNYIQNVTFEVPSDHRKWDAMIKKEIHCCWSVSWPSLDTQRRWDELLAASTNSLLFISCHICCGELSNCTPKYQIVSTLPYHCGKRDDVLQGEISIAAEVICNLLQTHKNGVGRFWQHLQVSYCSHHVIFIKANYQIAHQIQDFGYPPCTGNGAVYCKERYPSLLKYFITFLRCIHKMGGPSDSIYKPLIFHIVTNTLRLASKLHTNHQIWDTLFLGDMWYHVMKRDIYCWWSVS